MANSEQPEPDTTAPVAPRWLHDADQVEQKYEEAVAVAVETLSQAVSVMILEGHLAPSK